MSNPALVEVLRGGAIESVHCGALAVTDSAGRLVLALGDVERPVFPRSAVKAIQALPLVESGAAARFALGDDALAMACASHNGEPLHTQTAAGTLASVGLDAGVLECGCHWPLLDTAQRALAADGGMPTALHNNCSGKHAGFVCLGGMLAPGDAARDPEQLRRWLTGYVEPQHPVMREVTAALGGVTGTDLSIAPRGVDGCSIPTYAMPLRALALGFARLGTGDGLSPARAAAASRLRAAVAAAPWMVAGTGRLDTQIAERLGARAFVKVGAEGVYCAALPEPGWGVAIKIDDGATRAAEVALATVLSAVLALASADAAWLHGLTTVTLRNWHQIDVGSLRAATPLQRALATVGRAP